MIVVDADEGRRQAMVSELRSHGLTVNHRSTAPPSRAVSGLLRAAKAGFGPEAWSPEALIELAGGASLGFDVSKTGSLVHPVEPHGALKGTSICCEPWLERRICAVDMGHFDAGSACCVPCNQTHIVDV